MNSIVVASMVLMALPLAGCGQDLARVVAVVQDDTGAPVTNAPVVMFTFKRWIPGPEFGRDEFDRADAKTDTNGVAVITMPSARGEFSLRTMPMEGFYFDRGVRFRLSSATGGRWQPWGQTNVLVVRQIDNPIAMCARAFRGPELMVPENGKPVGFDLMKGDWVAPYGGGSTADFVFNVRWVSHGRNETRHLRYEAQMDLSFANDGDGLFEMRVPCHAPPCGSVYRMPRTAPADGYAPQFSRTQFRSDKARSEDPPPDVNYFFRVRTRRDANGAVASALYGKIHGPLQVGVVDAGACIEMCYYLNPTPNDRNTEFDPKRNLLKSDRTRQVNDP